MSDRELTYSDADDGLAAPPADFDTHPDEPTAQDAGKLMARLWDAVSCRAPARLHYRDAVDALRDELGGRYLCGPAGNQWIDPLAVEAFERRVGRCCSTRENGPGGGNTRATGATARGRHGPPQRLEIGIVWRHWRGDEAHTLGLGPAAFAFLVDTGRDFLPLADYLRGHPDRRDEAEAVLRERLA